MNFDYSYRAFLITCLLFGILFLTLYTFKLGEGYEQEVLSYDVEYLEEEEPVSEEELAKLEELEQRAIETNRAYNEASKFLNDLDYSEMTLEEKLAEIDEAIDESGDSDTAEEIRKARERLEEARELAKKNKDKTKNGASSANRNTTISYRLKDRRAMYLPNPVYTCESGGIIVINITVNERGEVIRTSYNKNASTTTNGCLIDSAIEYAEQASFSTAAGKDSQLGTITYSFPGQYD